MILKPGSLPPIKRGGHQTNQSNIQKKGVAIENPDYYAQGGKKKRAPSIEKAKAAPKRKIRTRLTRSSSG